MLYRLERYHEMLEHFIKRGKVIKYLKWYIILFKLNFFYFSSMMP